MEDRLIKFAKLAEAGSFTRAANELHISQPALSMAIQKLETELHCVLLTRRGHKIELTSAGNLVYQAALEQHDLTSNLRSSLARLARKRPATKIGMIDSVASKLCATAAFDALESAADVTLIIDNSRQLRAGVERRSLDCAFVVEDDTDHPNIEARKLGSERLYLVAKPDLLADTAQATQSRQLPHFISYDKSSTTYRLVQQHLFSHGVQARIRLYSTSPSVMLSMVLRGKGSAALPDYMVQPYITSGDLQTIISPVNRPITLLTMPSKVLPGTLASFIESAQMHLSANC